MPDCKVLIADDEKLAREALKLHLQEVPDVAVIAECSNGKEALEAIVSRRPDLVFLDIQMPYLSGLEILEKLGEHYAPAVIFVTAFDSYAVQAFEHEAVDYLVKPFTEERFKKALQKALRTLHNPHTNDTTALEEMKRMVQHLSALRGKTTISIRDGSKVYLVSTKDISHIEAAGNYASFFTHERKYLHKETLQMLEADLPPSFVRIHKSVIVNTEFIKELHSQYNGDYLVKLTTGHELRLSRNFRGRLAHLF
jgi:two-component system LytT family response regulator